MKIIKSSIADVINLSKNQRICEPQNIQSHVYAVIENGLILAFAIIVQLTPYGEYMLTDFVVLHNHKEKDELDKIKKFLIEYLIRHYKIYYIHLDDTNNFLVEHGFKKVGNIFLST